MVLKKYKLPPRVINALGSCVFGNCDEAIRIIEDEYRLANLRRDAVDDDLVHWAEGMQKYHRWVCHTMADSVMDNPAISSACRVKFMIAYHKARKRYEKTDIQSGESNDDNTMVYRPRKNEKGNKRWIKKKIRKS